jgi:DNA modification methylase
MKLTDNEIRDINRFLEAGKPLPDHYRFLLFGEKREVELVWNGKTHEVCNIVLPFQVVEQIDEPRAEDDINLQVDMFSVDNRGRQLKGWTNKLIWGDNKLILSSLKNGPLRKEIEDQGGIKLIYIDPPFDVGADFSMNIEIGDEQFTKEPSVLEELAYRDTWGKGADSFITMIYERLSLMRDLLADDGSIYVHCDWRMNSYLRTIMDEIFSKHNLVNEIIWKRANHKTTDNMFMISHDTILFYSKSKDYLFNPQYSAYEKDYIDNYYNNFDSNGRRYQLQGMYGKGAGNSLYFGDRLISPPNGLHWRWTQERINEAMEKGLIVFPRDGEGMPRFKDYLDDKKGVPVRTIWDDVYEVNSQALERLDYPTQKPESLIERIVNASSNENDIVCDFFCGSGTTLAVAEKLGRKWIGSDLGKFAIHTTRKRMIGVQRELKKANKPYRAFEILNLGKYERQHYIGVNANLRDREKQEQIAEREREFLELILRAYRAEPAEGFTTFHGKKNNRMVAVGPINLPVTRLYVDDVINECRQKYLPKVDILAFEFEMGLSPNAQDEAKNKGIDLALKYIPREVFDKRAVEKNQVVFHDVSYIEVKPLRKEKKSGKGAPAAVAVQLTDFSVYYNQDTIAHAEESLKNGGSKIVVENGQIIKVLKDKNGIVKREVLTKKWTDWIDYWAVDFDYESKKEIIRVKKEKADALPPAIKPGEQLPMDATAGIIEYEEVWTGDYIFENEWQSFRTKKDRKLELTSVYYEYPNKGRYKIAVKVVDIFGNDTMRVIEVGV